MSEMTVQHPDDQEGLPVPADKFAGGMDALARSEIDVQVATAHRYPRNIKLALTRAASMALLDEDTAASCFYVLPRDGKNIEGPSVRLAEIMASSWGNMRSGARIIDEGEKFIIAQGFAHDLETNNATGMEVAQRITKKNGQRYNDDMIAVASAAAQAKAYRNAVFKVIPRAYVNKIMREAKRVAVGDAASLVDRRTKALEWFAKAGVQPDRILAKLGKPSVDAIDLDDLAALIGLSTAIRDRMTTVDAAFPPVQAAGAEPSKPADVAAHVASIAEKVKPHETPDVVSTRQPDPVTATAHAPKKEPTAERSIMDEVSDIETMLRAGTKTKELRARIDALPEGATRAGLLIRWEGKLGK